MSSSDDQKPQQHKPPPSKENRGKPGDEGQSGGPERSPQPNMKMSRGMMGWLLLGGLTVMLVILLTSSQHTAKEIDGDDFINKATQNIFEDVIVEVAL